MYRNVLRKIAVFGSALAMLGLFSGCLYILELIQPAQVASGEQIVTTIKVEMDETGCGCPGGGPSGALVALMIPTDWTVDMIEYDGDYGPQEMEFLHPDSVDNRPEAGEDHWYVALEDSFGAPPPGYHWQVYQGPHEGWIGTDTTNVDVTIKMTPGADGFYDKIAYFVSITDFKISADSTEWDVRWNNAITVGTVGIEEKTLPGVPEAFALEQNFPNPFNPATTIRYSLKERSEVKLTVYNAAGQQVALLAEGNKAPGNYEVVFNPKDLPSGVYFYRLTAGNFVETRKMMLIQ